MTPPKRCTRCGADLPQGMDSCPVCGLAVPGVEEAILEKKDDLSGVSEARLKSRSGVSTGRLVVIFLVVLAVAAALVFILAGQTGCSLQAAGQPNATAGEIASADGFVETQANLEAKPTVIAVDVGPTSVPILEMPAQTATDLPPEIDTATPVVPTQTPLPAVESPTPASESFYAHYNLAFTSGNGSSFQIYLMDAENPEDWAVLPNPAGYERAYWPTFCGQSLAFDVEDQNYLLPRWVFLYDLVQDSLQSLDLPDKTIERAIFPSCSPRDSHLGVTISRGGKWFLDIFDLEQKQVVFELESGDYPLISNISWSYMQPDFYWMGTRRTGFTDINLTRNFVGNAETTLYAQGRYPALSPDGKYLVSFCGNLFHLCVFDLQTGEKVFQQSIHYAKEINGKQAAASAMWSPDGQWIYFVSSLSGNWDVYRMHPDGSELVNLTAGWGTDELMPATR